MTRSTGAPGVCPRGCGFTDAPHRVARHAKTCLTPRTIERMAEVGLAVRTDDGCLLWRGQRERAGYVRQERAYVIAFVIVNGPVPDGMEVCHRCDTPGCFEPTHLFAGTHGDNMRDASGKKRLGGSVTWTREQRLAAGLDGSKARAARWSR